MDANGAMAVVPPPTMTTLAVAPVVVTFPVPLAVELIVMLPAFCVIVILSPATIVLEIGTSVELNMSTAFAVAVTFCCTFDVLPELRCVKSTSFAATAPCDDAAKSAKRLRTNPWRIVFI